jgi:hypothetical protein
MFKNIIYIKQKQIVIVLFILIFIFFCKPVFAYVSDDLDFISFDGSIYLPNAFTLFEKLVEGELNTVNGKLDQINGLENKKNKAINVKKIPLKKFDNALDIIQNAAILTMKKIRDAAYKKLSCREDIHKYLMSYYKNTSSLISSLNGSVKLKGIFYKTVDITPIFDNYVNFFKFYDNQKVNSVEINGLACGMFVGVKDNIGLPDDGRNWSSRITTYPSITDATKIFKINELLKSLDIKFKKIDTSYINNNYSRLSPQDKKLAVNNGILLKCSGNPRMTYSYFTGIKFIDCGDLNGDGEPDIIYFIDGDGEVSGYGKNGIIFYIRPN